MRPKCKGAGLWPLPSPLDPTLFNMLGFPKPVPGQNTGGAGGRQVERDRFRDR